MCEKMVMRRSVNPNPKPILKPEPSSADVCVCLLLQHHAPVTKLFAWGEGDVAERGVASRGGRSSENLCVGEEYV